VTPNQLKVTRKAGCVHFGKVVAPADLPETMRLTIAFIVLGYSNPEIAEMRHYSKEAITRHVTALLMVFNARNRTHLAALAVSMGIVKV